MNANELKNHLREIMRTDIGQHLREVHGVAEADVPKAKTAQAKLHAEQDHGKDIEDAGAAKDAAVIGGVTRPASETAKRTGPVRRAKAAPDATPAPKAPARKTPAKAAPKPAPAKPATRTRPAAKAPAKATTKAAPKPASPKPAPAPKAEANGTSTREHNQTVARRLATLAAEAFADESPETKAKVAYWLHSLPTGSRDGSSSGSWNRWFPESLPRPETADWRAPA